MREFPNNSVHSENPLKKGQNKVARTFMAAVAALGLGVSYNSLNTSEAYAINSPRDNVDLGSIYESRIPTVNLGNREYQVVTLANSEPFQLSENQLLLNRINEKNGLSVTDQSGRTLSIGIEGNCITVDHQKVAEFLPQGGSQDSLELIVGVKTNGDKIQLLSGINSVILGSDNEVDNNDFTGPFTITPARESVEANALNNS